MKVNSYSENILFSSGKWKDEREYWLNKLGPSVEPSGFATDFREPCSHVDVPIRVCFPDSLTQLLQRACRQSPQGMYALLLASVLYVLYRYTGENKLLVGMPSSQQTTSNLNPEKLIAQRMDVDEEMSFKDYLLNVSQTVQEAKKYKNISFGTIVRWLKEDPDALVPSFRTVVALNILHSPEQLQDVRADMKLQFALEGDDLFLDLIDEGDLYSRDFKDQIGRHLIRFLEEALEDAGILLKHIQMLHQEETFLLEQAFNATNTPYDRNKTIHELIDYQAAQTADLPALCFEDQEMTYGQLMERSDRLACLLRRKSIDRNRVVAVMTKRSLEMIVAILAVMKAGGTYLPIDPTYPPDRIKHMLDDSGTKLLLTQSGLLKTFAFQGETVDVNDPGSFPEVRVPVPNVNHSEDAAYLIYTSGSTGFPKGVLVSHRSVVNFITGITNRITFKEGSTIAAVTTFSFDIFVLETLLPLTRGLRVAIAGEAEQHNPGLLKKWLSLNRVEILQATPSRIQLLLNEKQDVAGMELLTTLIVGGEVLPNELLNQLRSKLTKAHIYNMYGPTETTVWSSVKDMTKDNYITLGSPIANTSIYIVDSSMRLVPLGVAGELCIAGDGVAIGYWQRDALNAERFVESPFAIGGRMYRTGDLARRLSNGEIEFLGRIDHQVKIRGYRVELGEVESVLISLPSIEAAVCVAKTDNNGNKLICAYYISSQLLSADTFKSSLSSRLPEYMLPSFYIPLDRLPYTPNGKVDRKQLPNPFSMDRGLLEYEPPSDEMEMKLLEIWKEVLGVDRIGATDDFFNIGGHSLKALKLEVELDKAGFSFESDDIFRYPTIRGFLRRSSERTTALPLNENAITISFDRAKAEAITISHEERIEPFNDVFYKECFYNSLFPAVRYYGQSLLPILFNDTINYLYDEVTLYFKVEYRETKPLLQLLNELGIGMKTRSVGASVIKALKTSILGDKPVILRINCYYASNRVDTFGKIHWPHSWLVFGFDDSKQMFCVIEHDHVEKLNYRKQWVSYEDTANSHLGYIEKFGTDKPAYYELFAIEGRDLGSAPSEDVIISMLASAMKQQEHEIKRGLQALFAFMASIENALQDERLIKDFADDLIGTLNQIVNAKLLNKYRFQQLSKRSDQLNMIMDESIEAWKRIREVLAKAVFAGRMKARIEAFLHDQCELARNLEHQYQEKLFDSISRIQKHGDFIP